jgi:hypothetical protein
MTQSAQKKTKEDFYFSFELLLRPLRFFAPSASGQVRFEKLQRLTP